MASPGTFRGVHGSFQENGTVLLPADFATALHEKGELALAVTPGCYQACLSVYPFSDWRRLEERARELPQFDQHVQDFQLTYMAPMQRCSVLEGGRVYVPQALQAVISDDEGSIAIVGAGRFFEIWSGASWRRASSTARARLLGELPQKLRWLVDGAAPLEGTVDLDVESLSHVEQLELALAIAQAEGRQSITTIQRVLRIGYRRALLLSNQAGQLLREVL